MPEITDVVSDWNTFFQKRQKYRDQASKIEREFPYFRTFEISISDMQAGGMAILNEADALYTAPNKALSSVRQALYRRIDLKTEQVDRVRIRFCEDPRVVPLKNITTDYINRFLTFEGIIRKISEKRPLATAICFRCRVCGALQTIPQGRGGQIDPDGCPNADCKNRSSFSEVPEKSQYIDFQMCRIEEFPEGLRGTRPRTFDIHLTEDLCERIAPGDRVKISGILKVMPRKVSGEKSTSKDWYLDANHIEINEKSYQDLSISEEDEAQIIELSQSPKIYQLITDSIAPSIYGVDHIKEAIALQLFGGIRKEMPNGSTPRGDIHILMVGDPGIAKSEIMRNVINLSPRGIFTSGKSTSAAGLTASAVKDDFGNGGWTLEAGALVLADMGMAAVDELDKMSKEDRSSLHEAMEQQSISVSKAGIIATLNSRCALLAAANPKMGRFDPSAPISEEINMPPSLLSRFDLIFVMADTPQADLDAAVAAQILDNHEYGELTLRREPVPDRLSRVVTAPIPPETLRKYIGYAKKNCVPLLTPAARERLNQYYLSIRGLADSNKPVPITARQLGALIRLAEASARVRLSNEVTADDATRAITLVDACLRQVAFDASTGNLDIDRISARISKSTRAVLSLIERAVHEVAGPDHKAAPAPMIRDYLLKSNIPAKTADSAIKTLINQKEIVESNGKIILLNG